MTEKGRLKIYCSGPLFCAEEVAGMQAIASSLESAGMRTFLPHRDGLEPWVMRLANLPGQEMLPGVRRRVDQAIFALDVYQLAQACDALVFNMNGRVPDEGGIVEASIAFAIGKPVILYKKDIRAPFGGQDNARLLGLTDGHLVQDLAILPDRVRQLVKHTGHPVETLSPALERTLASGRRIATLLDKLPRRLGKQTWDQAVVSRVLEAIDIDD